MSYRKNEEALGPVMGLIHASVAGVIMTANTSKAAASENIATRRI